MRSRIFRFDCLYRFNFVSIRLTSGVEYYHHYSNILGSIDTITELENFQSLSNYCLADGIRFTIVKQKVSKCIKYVKMYQLKFPKIISPKGLTQNLICGTMGLFGSLHRPLRRPHRLGPVRFQ